VGEDADMMRNVQWLFGVVFPIKACSYAIFKPSAAPRGSLSNGRKPEQESTCVALSVMAGVNGGQDRRSLSV